MKRVITQTTKYIHELNEDQLMRLLEEHYKKQYPDFKIEIDTQSNRSFRCDVVATKICMAEEEYDDIL